jgi:hypothetical protein
LEIDAKQRMCLLGYEEELHIQEPSQIILQLKTRQHWCVLLPVQLLLSATDLNNSNKQTSPAIRAQLLQQLLHTHVTPDNLNFMLQACCARLSAASGLTSALTHAAVQSVCVAVQAHSDVGPRYATFLSSWSSIELPAFPSRHGCLKETAAAIASSAPSISPLKRIRSLIACPATSTRAVDHSK